MKKKETQRRKGAKALTGYRDAEEVQRQTQADVLGWVNVVFLSSSLAWAVSPCAFAFDIYARWFSGELCNNAVLKSSFTPNALRITKMQRCKGINLFIFFD